MTSLTIFFILFYFLKLNFEITVWGKPTERFRGCSELLKYRKAYTEQEIKVTENQNRFFDIYKIQYFTIFFKMFEFRTRLRSKETGHLNINFQDFFVFVFLSCFFVFCLFFFLIITEGNALY